MGANEIFRPDVMRTIEETLTALSSELRELSLKIHGEYPLNGNVSVIKLDMILCRSPRAWFPGKVCCLNPFSFAFSQHEPVLDTRTIP
jgi:hypothetical protein